LVIGYLLLVHWRKTNPSHDGYRGYIFAPLSISYLFRPLSFGYLLIVIGYQAIADELLSKDISQEKITGYSS